MYEMAIKYYSSIEMLLSVRSCVPLMVLPRGRSIGRLCAAKTRSGWITSDPLIETAVAFPRNQQAPDLDDYRGKPYIPVYVMLPVHTISMGGELEDPDNLVKQLNILKSSNVEGVTIECWWGIVEGYAPLHYNWSGYRKLFQMIRDLDLKIQVVMCFHAFGGNVGDDVHIPLPLWVTEIGRKNPDIFFMDKEERRNHEYLTWGIDEQRILRDRNAIDVYFDFMRRFRQEFNELFVQGFITAIEIGVGPCGELRYPSHAANHGWKYPGIGEFQCYDKYLKENLVDAAEARLENWFLGKGPKNAGSYNSKPQDTEFFCDGGDYDGFYGRFFLKWYSDHLVDHADRVLAMGKTVFVGTPISIKLPIIHWWYNTPSHAAELTAGFYNSCNRDGYKPIASILKKHGIRLNFACIDQPEGFQDALADPQGLARQVLYTAWEIGIPVALESILSCYDKKGYNKILGIAKPITSSVGGRHLFAYTYLRLCRLSPKLLEEANIKEFKRFVNILHGIK